MPNRALVVDANILIRAVLGKRVRAVLEAHAESVSFFIPEAYCEAEEHLAALVVKRGGDPDKALALLRSLGRLMERVGDEVYGSFEAEARERLDMRDQDDWPILAAALAIGCPIWTEDSDFFGCGVATWTSNRVQLFLREARPRESGVE
jgi:predicted nucleic acid-binding protein